MRAELRRIKMKKIGGCRILRKNVPKIVRKGLKIGVSVEKGNTKTFDQTQDKW